MQSQIDRLLAAGAHAYLTKPIDVAKFIAVLDRTLQQPSPLSDGLLKTQTPSLAA